MIMDSDRILILNLGMSLISFILIAKWYLMPWLSRLPREKALQPLLLLHTFRHIGMMFLASGALTRSLPEEFAIPAAYGDLLTAFLALVALVALRLGWAAALPLVWLFNIVGTLDLIYAVTQGALNKAAGGMGAAFWIPSILVPALLVTHFLVFVLLLKDKSRGGDGA
jgi:hypothetical protein